MATSKLDVYAMARSLRVNFLFNVINTIAGMLFPVITFPYVSRILLADGIGQVNFFVSIISYIVLITGIGIPMYGIREIARVRDNKKQLTQVTVEILLLNLIMNCLGYAVVLVMCFTISQIISNIPLFLILSSSILLTTIGCNWFYNGIEEFKFIAIRSLIVRIIAIIFLFIFVKTKEDLLLYGVYTIINTVGANFINIYHLKKYINIELVKASDLKLFRHIRPSFEVFMFSIVSSIYLNLDKVMLGFMKGALEVGYYTAASQIAHILLTFVVALGTVLLPRASNLIKNKQYDEFYRITKSSFHAVLLMGLPICIGTVLMSDEIVNIFCGESYGAAVRTLQIIIPIVLIIGTSQFLGMQILYPIGKIKYVTFTTCIGAIVNLVLNILLVPYYAQNGAAVATIVAELSVTLTQFIIVKKMFPITLFSTDTWKYFFATAVMTFFCVLISVFLHSSYLVRLISVSLSGVVIYLLILYITKETFVLKIINVGKSRILNNGNRKIH